MRFWLIRVSIIVPLLAALMLTGGCAKKTSDRSLVFLGPAEGQQIVSGGKSKLLGLAGKASAVWVDPRPAAAYREGHIEGAINIPLKEVLSEYESLRRYDVVIVYGNSYRDPVSEGMSKRLLQLGLKDVRTLRGGLKAWQEAGLPLETSE